MKKTNFKSKLLIFCCCLMAFVLSANAQTVIKGTVKDSKGLPVSGAPVKIKGGTTGTITDNDGNFSLSIKSLDKAVLIISSIGYDDATVDIKASSTSYNVVLKEAGSSLAGVVVTANNSRRSQMELPISVSTFGQTKLSNLKFNSNADILRTVPGISAEGGGGDVASNVFVRGLPSGGQYQFTPLQIDGMPVISTMGLNSSAADVYYRNDLGINNIEFVRGGSSTLYGAGSVAGIINYTSKVGSNTSKTIIETEVATPGKTKFDFNTGGSITENSLFYNISGTYRYDEGPVVTGLPSNGYQLRGNLKKVLNDGALTFYFQYIDDKAQFFLPYPLTADRKRPVGYDGVTINTLQTSDVVLLSAKTPNGIYQSQANNGVFTKGGYFMLDFQKEFGKGWKFNAKVRSARYQHQFNFFGTDGSGINPATQANFLKVIAPSAVSGTYTFANDNSPLSSSALVLQNNITDRIRPLTELSTLITLNKAFQTGKVEHNLTFGAFAARTEAGDLNIQFRYLSEFKDRPRLLNLSYTDATNTVTKFTNNGVVSLPGYTNKTISSKKKAFYVSDEARIGKLRLDAGFRVESITGDGSIEKTATAKNADGINVAWGTGAFDRFSVSTSDWALALAANYAITKNVFGYVNYSKGYFFPELRGVSVKYTGGIAAYPKYQPEKINQYEAGVKLNLPYLTFTLAYFSENLNDRLQVNYLNVNGSVQEISKYVNTKSSGIESSFDWTFAKNLHLTGSVTSQQATYTKDETTPANEGKWVERQPRFMYDAGIYYNNQSFDISFSNNYAGKRYGNASNAVELDPYSISRLSAGYNFMLDKKTSLRISGGIFNVFNSEGITEGNPRAGDTQSNTGDYFVGRPILPRATYLRATLTF